MNKHLPLNHQIFRGAKSFTLCEVTCEDSDETVRLYERSKATPIDPLTCFFTLYGHWPNEQGPTLALLDGSEAGMKAQAFTLFEQGAAVDFIDRNGLRVTLQESCSRHLVHATETHGEEQLSQFVLLSVPQGMDADDAAETLASNWWRDFTDHDHLTRYVRQDGSASVEIDSVYTLSEETFQELKGKISCYDSEDLAQAKAAANREE